MCRLAATSGFRVGDEGSYVRVVVVAMMCGALCAECLCSCRASLARRRSLSESKGSGSSRRAPSQRPVSGWMERRKGWRGQWDERGNLVVQYIECNARVNLKSERARLLTEAVEEREADDDDVFVAAHSGGFMCTRVVHAFANRNRKLPPLFPA